MARQLRVFGVVLLVLYGANSLTDILPLQIINPLWQIGAANTLVNNAGIAGTGLILLHLAHYVANDSGRVLALRRIIAHLTTIAALGFLLLIPLQISAVTRGLLNVQENISQQVEAIDRQANRYRTEIRQSTNIPELQRRMVAVSGPVPGPDDLRTPLPELKQNLLKLVDLETARLKGNIDRSSFRQETWTLLMQTLRICISSLALALGFGVLAQHDAASPTPLLKLWGGIRKLPQALKSKQRESNVEAMERQAMKRFRSNLARLNKRNQRFAREAERKEAGSVIEKAKKFFFRATGQNRKGPPRR